MTSAFTASLNCIADRLISEAYVESNNEKMYITSALWDTGATKTCISQAVVDRLGLKPVSQTMVRTPSGERLLNVYIADVVLRNNVKIVDWMVIGSEIGNQEIDLLIGMDIITLGDFAVSNSDGKTQFSFCIPSLGKIDFVKQIKDCKQNK